jgi:solute carrier family 25 folate transporter 32
MTHDLSHKLTDDALPIIISSHLFIFPSSSCRVVRRRRLVSPRRLHTMLERTNSNSNPTSNNNWPTSLHFLAKTVSSTEPMASVKENNVLQAHSFAPMAAGVSAGTVSTALLLPLDNIKVRLQVHENENGSNGKGTNAAAAAAKSGENRTARLGTLRVVRGVIRHEGLAGFYQGLAPAVLGSSLSWGGFFFVYEGLKKQLKDRKELTNSNNNGGNNNVITLTPWDNFSLAVCSGAAMVALTNPIWLIKLRMQLQMKKASEALSRSQHPQQMELYTGMVDAARKIVRDEGFWALYKGSVPALLLTSHGGVQFVVYEFLRKHFHDARRVKRDYNINGGASLSVTERLEKSFGYLTMGAISKM